jgi:hypothetical protein
MKLFGADIAAEFRQELCRIVAEECAIHLSQVERNTAVPIEANQRFARWLRGKGIFSHNQKLVWHHGISIDRTVTAAMCGGG